MTGADLADWLECAASCFHQVLPGMGATPQPLWNAAFAIHAFDTVSDLSYRIDLGQPPRHDANGTLLNPQARRIRDLRYRGAPIAPEARFCVATNNFRAFGGGPYPPATPGQIVHQSQTSVRDLLVAHLRREGEISRTDPLGDRGFDGPSDATLLIETGPGVRNHPKDLAAVSARELGVDAQGFLRLAVPLAALADLANPGETS
jgi:2',3'-cyclic-nucleotide 2'-phosphodiesterase/3'-nucleotidase